MAAVLNLFWNLCLLRVGPAAVPAYTWFVAAVVAADIALSTFVGVMVGDGALAAALSLAVVSLATVAVVTWAGLRITGETRRFPATLAALAGSDVLLSLAPANSRRFRSCSRSSSSLCSSFGSSWCGGPSTAMRSTHRSPSAW